MCIIKSGYEEVIRKRVEITKTLIRYVPNRNALLRAFLLEQIGSLAES